LKLNGVRTYDIAYFNWQSPDITIRFRSDPVLQ